METRNVFIQVIKKPARKNGFTFLRSTVFASEQTQAFVFARSYFKSLRQLSKSIEKSFSSKIYHYESNKNSSVDLDAII